MKRYWSILKKYKSNLILSPVLVFIYVICETYQPFLMSKIIDDGIMFNDLDIVYSIGIQMILISIVGLFAVVINIRISSKTAVGFGTDLRSELFRKIQQLSFSDIDNFSTASLITRLTNDNSKIQQIILISMRLLLRSPLLLVAATFFAITINPELAIVLIASIPILALLVYLILSKGFPYFMKIQQKVDRLNSVVRENLINIRVVKSFVREDYENKKFERTNEELRDIVIRASNIIVTIFPAMQLVLNLSILCILWFGGYKVMSGDMRVGELVSFVNYLSQILMSLMILSMVIMSFARAAASSKRVIEVLNCTSFIRDTTEAASNNYTINQGSIIFDNVFFRYSGGENDVLKNININIENGETVALVGVTGSAKSTLLQLIPRLYDVSSGKILIDNINVKDYKLGELHKKVSMVLQNNELFTGTIDENLCWGNENATKEEIEQAARAAIAHDFIMSFPDGYQTILGRSGVNLSGGQKQRLCIARALLRKPKILLLDDSTSAVDAKTEQTIRTNMKRLLSDTTVFIVSQRISTIQEADKIIVIDDGEIEAIGSHKQLLEQSETYKEIYNSQQLEV